jgi:transposase InsO family protein
VLSARATRSDYKSLAQRRPAAVAGCRDNEKPPPSFVCCEGVRRHFGGFAKDIACGLAMRHDHGSRYMSDHFQKEMAFLGIERSPAFVRAPEGIGCAERFIRTLKENLLWIRTFETIEELRQALLEFRETYNTTWLIERHGFVSPAAFRQSQLQPAAKAA